jgi:hypothetical protein
MSIPAANLRQCWVTKPLTIILPLSNSHFLWVVQTFSVQLLFLRSSPSLVLLVISEICIVLYYQIHGRKGKFLDVISLFYGIDSSSLKKYF